MCKQTVSHKHPGAPFTFGSSLLLHGFKRWDGWICLGLLLFSVSTFSVPWYCEDKSLVMLLSLFCKEVIIPRSSFETISVGSSPLIPRHFSQCVSKRHSNNLIEPEFVSTVICFTQSSQHNLSYRLQRGQSLQKVLFPTPILPNLKSWKQFMQPNNAEKDLGIMSKMIQNLTLKNPYSLKGWNFLFLKRTANPHVF